MKEVISVPLPLPELYRSVASYWEIGRGWKWRQLEHILPGHTLEKLAATIVCNDPGEKDEFGWSNDSSSKFSVSSAYGQAIGSINSIEAAKWNNVWKLKVSNRMCIFAWLIRHGRIMTNYHRFKCGMTSNDKCWLCKTVVEDT